MRKTTIELTDEQYFYLQEKVLELKRKNERVSMGSLIRDLIDTDVSFLEQRRQVTFDWHITQVLKWLKYDNGRKLDSVLVYTSVELRCAIERYIFELLILLKSLNMSSEDEKRCRSKDGILALMIETEPYYKKRANFTNLIASVSGIPKVTIVDIKYLIRKWHELSDYCHKQLRPEESFDSLNRKFQEKGFNIIYDVVNRFKKWEYNAVFGIIDKQSMPLEVGDVYEKYINDEIDEGQAERMLNLMGPILKTRLR